MVDEPSYGPAWDAAALLLSLLVQGYTEADVDLPERQYVTPGIVPAYDDPQLTVSVQAVRFGQPGSQLEGATVTACQPRRYVTLRVELLRCTPVVQENGDPPTVDALNESAQEILRDLALVDDIMRASRDTLAGKGDPVHGVGRPIAMSGSTPLGPQGALAGVRSDVDVPL